jgi:phosphoribosylaminoimidazole (AIR) synthetase
MVLVVNKSDSQTIQDFINTQDLKCWEIGSVRTADSSKDEVEFI